MVCSLSAASTGTRYLWLLVVTIVICMAPALGAQEGLYASSAPEDASLVRVINAGDDTPEWTIDIGPVSYPDVASMSGTPYRPVQPGIYMLFSAGSRVVFSPLRAQFYTVARTVDGYIVFEEERHTDPARAQIVFYNLTGQPVTLAALVPEATLFSDVAAGTSDMVVLNAIPVTLAALDGDGTRSSQLDVTLERGASYGVVAVEGDTGVDIFLVRAEVSAE